MHKQQKKNKSLFFTQINSTSIFQKSVYFPLNRFQLPNFINIQLLSFQSFLKEGLIDEFKKFNEVQNSNQTLQILVYAEHYKLNRPKWTPKQAILKKKSYSCELYLPVQLLNKKSNEAKFQWVLFAHLPLMTKHGHFIVNGCPRVLMNQMVRSPGVYFKVIEKKNRETTYCADFIAQRGSWLRLEIDTKKGNIWAKLKKTPKIPVLIFLQALGLSLPVLSQNLDFEKWRYLIPLKQAKQSSKALKNDIGIPLTNSVNLKKLKSIFSNLKAQKKMDYLASCQKYWEELGNFYRKQEKYASRQNLLELVKRGQLEINQLTVTKLRPLKKPLRPAKPKQLLWLPKSIWKTYFHSLLALEKQVYLSELKATEFQSKNQIEKVSQTLANQPLKFEETQILKTTRQRTKSDYWIKAKSKRTNQERAQKFLFRKFQNNRTYDLSLLGRARLNQKLGLNIALNYTLLTAQDILAACLILMDLLQGVTVSDDIDDLKNRQINSSGKLIQLQLATGLIRFEKIIREKLKKNQVNAVDFSNLFTLKPINQCFREFFGSSPLSQLMDQTNALAEITHKRRLSSLGPGGINRENAGMAIRGIHATHYGRICPIETPEGQNAGLVNSFTIYSHLNAKGFLETPFYQTYKGFVFKEKPPLLFSSDQEKNKVFVPGDIPTSLLNFLPSNVQIPSRQMNEFQKVSRNSVHFSSISPLQMISVATSLIPFLEHDDGNRALMGSNMQRQAVPTVRPSKPIVGTGVESRVIANIGYNLQAHQSGFVSYVDGHKIILYSKKLPKQSLDESFWFNFDNLTKKPKSFSGLNSKLLSKTAFRFQTKLTKGKTNTLFFQKSQGNLSKVQTFFFENFWSKSQNLLSPKAKRTNLVLSVEKKASTGFLFKKNLLKASKKARYLQQSKLLFSFLKSLALPSSQSLNLKYNFQFYIKQNESFGEKIFVATSANKRNVLPKLFFKTNFCANLSETEKGHKCLTKDFFSAQKQLYRQSYFVAQAYSKLGSYERQQRQQRAVSESCLNSKYFYFLSNQLFLNNFGGQLNILLFFYKNLTKSPIFEKKNKLFFSKYFLVFLKQFSHQTFLLLYCHRILASFQKFSLLSFSNQHQKENFLKNGSKNLVQFRFEIINNSQPKFLKLNPKIENFQKKALTTRPLVFFNFWNLTFLKKISSLQKRSSIFKKLKKVQGYSNFQKIYFANAKINTTQKLSFFRRSSFCSQKQCFIFLASTRSQLPQKFWSLYFFESFFDCNTGFLKKKSFFDYLKKFQFFATFKNFENLNQTEFPRQIRKKPLQKFLNNFCEFSKKKQSKIFLTQNGLVFKLKFNPKLKSKELKKFLYLKQNFNFEFLSLLPSLKTILPESKPKFTWSRFCNSFLGKMTLSPKLIGYTKSALAQKLLPYALPKMEKKQKLSQKKFQKSTTNLKKKIADPFFDFVPFKYTLNTYHRSNQDTYMIHRPLVQEGQWVEKGDTLVDSSTSVQGELSIGQNLLVGYTPWEGYNFEDAVLISEKVVFSDFFTSLHIERYEVEVCDTEFGMEQITNQIPDKPSSCNYLEANGLAKLGTWVEEGDILVGKIAPRGEKKLTPYENLLYAILDKEVSKTRDTSLRVPKGVKGRVIHIEIVESNQKKKQKASKESKISSSSTLPNVKTKIQKTLKKKISPFLTSEKENFFDFFFKCQLKKKPFALAKKLGKSEKKKTILTFVFPKQTLTLRKNANQNANSESSFHQRKSQENQSFSQLKLPLTFSKSQLFRKGEAFKTTISSKTTNKEPVYFLFSNSKQKNSLFVFQKLLNKESQLFQKKTKIYKQIGEIKREALNQKLATTFLTLDSKKKKAISHKFLPADFQSLNTSKNFRQQKFQILKPSLPFFAASNSKKSFEQKVQTQIKVPLISNKLPKTKLVQINLKKSFQKKALLSESTALAGLKKVHVYLAVKRKLQIGDKIAGRHGNKGIISNILPRQDMPYLPDGTPLDIVLNPLGVPSRMNVGQIFECLLGLAGYYLKQNYKVQPFDEVYGCEASRSLVYSKLYEARLKTNQDWLFNPNFPGKVRLFDGRSGECFEQPVTVGVAYILKLIHLVDEKIHARSTGPYSLITQQPLRGRSKQGGQRVGEMEVWALEGFGAAYILQEILTLKSDDLKGRQQVLNSILTFKSFYVGIPESFKVLVRELQALCLDFSIYKNKTNHKGKIVSTSIDINHLKII
uniref:DNA-directed RNA polymerase subunit beta n=1 Tax=Gloeotilopsis planctonica TaxID=34157 RepID=A0A1B2RZ51_9CHLO|nr:beta subunit of RNA polymerase [Gloeotilopsis planctonica]